MTKFYRTVYTLEILSDRDVSMMSLRDVVNEMIYGDFSGVFDYKTEEVPEDRMRNLLTLQGSDPEFLLGEEEE